MTYKKGDKIIIKSNTEYPDFGRHGFAVGEQVTIKSSRNTIRGYNYYECTSGDNRNWSVLEEDISTDEIINSYLTY